MSNPAASEPIALVLAGGGARGAYEIGALSQLLPALAARGERVDIVVGTSVGALNATYVAANAHRPAAAVVADGVGIWTSMTYRDVLEPLVSLGAVPRLVPLLAQLAGLPAGRAHALLDPAPLAGTLERLVSFRRLRRNVMDGNIDVAAVVATSGLTSRSVVFHHGHPLGVSGEAPSPPADPKRGIDYVAAALTAEHVRASAAIPAVFPAVHVRSPAGARGWYFDGGTRLNTPIKPALSLGARRVIVIGLNSVAGGPPGIAGPDRPDLYAGVAQLIQGVLVDPLVNDIRTLATRNTTAAASADPDEHTIPYMFVAPRRREAIGELAVAVYNEYYRGLTGARRSPDVALLGRLVNGGASPLHGELLSYLFFEPEFARVLVDLGREDARRWLAATHDDGPWRLRPLPGEEKPAQAPPRSGSAQRR